MALRITELASCGGCAAKVAPAELGTIMARLPRPPDEAVLVGTETGDDAGVYRLSNDQAIVCTADFITPLVDDPRLYGQIAAANAISDVYAMGGRPMTALALCMFPKELDAETASQILAGGVDKATEAGVAVIGGHTVRAAELFYGLAVTGLIDPRRIIRNFGARPGDLLILTKPLGSGLVVNGMRKGVLTLAQARPAMEIMATLNRVASEVMVSCLPDVHAATDVTGFALTGHALGMAAGSRVTMAIDLDRLPLYPGVLDLVGAGVTTGATPTNRAHAASRLVNPPEDKRWNELIHDPQTSGGLLLAVARARAEQLVGDLRERGVTHAAIIGEVLSDAAERGRLVVRDSQLR